MSKHVEEKSGKLYFQCSKFQKGNNSYKIIYKISAQYVEACRRKERKLYFQCSKFQKGNNSYKNWRKFSTLELDL